MIVEMHSHTSEHSACSHVSAMNLILKSFEMGLQAIVLTDHHYYWNDEELRHLREKAGVPEIFYIFSGQEVATRDFGDVLVYGARESIPRGAGLRGIRERFQEAAIIWAHPYRNKHIPSPERLKNPLLDGIEIFSSNHSVSEATRAFHDWHELKFTAIGGTDIHALSYTGSYPTIFDHPVQTIDELVAEIKAGRCRPYFKEVPKTGTTRTKIIELTVGPETPKGGQKMIIKKFEDAESWKSAKRVHYITEAIIKQGFDSGPFRIPKSLGKDKINLALVEERVEGETLYDMIVKAQPQKAEKYLQITAQWLAKLHKLRLKLTPESEFLETEPDRLNYYLKDLRSESHKYLNRAEEIMDRVLQSESELVTNHPEILVQCHGDFHPKNIFIGINAEKNETFVSVIDFGSSFQLPRAFDVGTFMAQYVNMFFNQPRIHHNAPVDVFLKTYMNAAHRLEPDFLSQVNLFKARTCLSILYYLVKVGLGDSENFWKILIEAEQSLASIEFAKR